MDKFLKQAVDYAEKEWCWDDTVFIEETYEHEPPTDGLTPEDWIDWLATDLDLIHPGPWR